MSETPSVENDAARHWPECWCNGTGWRRELGVPCNLPQLTDAEHAYVFPPAARGANPYPNGHTHPSFVGCWEAKPLCPKYVTPPAEPEETR